MSGDSSPSSSQRVAASTPGGDDPSGTGNKPRGSIRSRIAAFESGAASNASINAANREIQAANLSDLRSRFEGVDDKPLVVRGPFGLGAPPPVDPSAASRQSGQRVISLGAGRAPVPLGSPSSSSSISSANAKTSTPSPDRQRPTSIRTASSALTTANSSSATTVSSLLPGPVAALQTPGRSGSGQDDVGGGLRTPMSSISLSSMMVETGSTMGDTSTTVDERSDIVSQPGTPLKEVTTPSAIDEDAAPDGKRVDAAKVDSGSQPTITTSDVDQPPQPQPQQGEESSIEPASAAELEKAEKAGIISPTTEGEDVKIPDDAAEKAQEELERYEKEEPSAPVDEKALFSPPVTQAESSAEDSSDAPRSTAVPILDVQDHSEPSTAEQAEIDAAERTDIAAGASTSDDKTSSPPNVSPSASPMKRTSSTKSNSSRPSSLVAPRLRRSSTANSLAESQPESDLGDTNLDTFDSDRLGVNPQPPVEQESAQGGSGGDEGITAGDDAEKAKQIGESIAPRPSSTEAKESDAPTADDTEVVAETVNKLSLEDREQATHASRRDVEPDAPRGADEDEADLDDAGMPKVKCSDCGVKVSLMELGEHVCGPTSPSTASNAVLSPSKVALPPTPHDVPQDEEPDDEEQEVIADEVVAPKSGESEKEERADDVKDVPEDTAHDAYGENRRAHGGRGEKLGDAHQSRNEGCDAQAPALLSQGEDKTTEGKTTVQKQTTSVQVGGGSNQERGKVGESVTGDGDEDKNQEMKGETKMEGSNRKIEQSSEVSKIKRRRADGLSGEAGSTERATATTATTTGDDEDEYMTALTSRRDSVDTVATNPASPGFSVETPSNSMRDLAAVATSQSSPLRSLTDASEDVGASTVTEDQGDVMKELADLTPRAHHYTSSSTTTTTGETRVGGAPQQRQHQQPDSPTPDRGRPHIFEERHSGASAGVGDDVNGGAGSKSPPLAGTSPRTSTTRRRTSPKTGNILGETDSESEAEPGTVTIMS